MYQLKTLLTTLLFSLIVNALCAQAELCDNCYIWEFTTDKGERNETTRLLSNDIEDILSSYAACKVLQRSKFAKLLEQINNEKAIQNLSGVKPELKTQLNAIQAKRVIFGEVNRDFTGNVSLRLSFDNLQTTLTKTNTIFLIGDDYYNFDKRKQKLTDFINSFIDPDRKLKPPPPPPTAECSRDNMPYQIENENVKVEFCQCYYYNNKITCPLWIRNKTNEPQRFELYAGFNNTRLIIDYGKDYTASNAILMSQSNVSWVAESIPATKNGVSASLIFSNIQTKSKSIESLEIGTSIGRESFPDVPLVHGPPPTK